MEDKQYSTYPGWTRADINHCLKCIWHGILVGRWVTCDYSLQEYHSRRDCRGGVGCKYFDDGKKKEPGHKAKRNRPDMATCHPGAFRAMVELVGKRRMQEITGYSRTGLDNAKRSASIKAEAAKKLLEETGLDITGGELVRGKK